ncbi:uncharacterized protein ColSpa_12605 [Colletotrichum spaethianum]|uniref:N-acetyltransferase domain-containing protein n=1 Tax=Colletotrichum spaethianum TaxID=700344 RepID=A0AA37UL97_9PEZI|nr:uncharacterized protein ColSpa_12605 [Colletotrichum spaethianum]GKT52424.1 hypothetical protein ColSpa_12605 [Colletotrichum spaethianum]
MAAASAAVVVEQARLKDAPTVADIFLKSFNSDFFQTLFPQNEYGRDYMTEACKQFMHSKQNGGQEGRLFVVRNEQGVPVAASLIWIVRPEDNGTWSWRKRWPVANAGQKDDQLEEFFTDMATQHHRIMGKDPHVCMSNTASAPFRLPLATSRSSLATQRQTLIQRMSRL